MTITKNTMMEVVSVKVKSEFTFTLGWLVKFYLYLLGGFSAALILQLEKMLVI
ncbi:MAG: hypothetical protein Q8L04_03525 [Ignavibacteria bacterium]|nr:hypothetical protein [Ignavibacteria bacterium]